MRLNTSQLHQIKTVFILNLVKCTFEIENDIEGSKKHYSSTIPQCDANKVPILRETPTTGTNDSVLKIIAETFSADPPIKVHPGIKRILKVRIICIKRILVRIICIKFVFKVRDAVLADFFVYSQ